MERHDALTEGGRPKALSTATAEAQRHARDETAAVKHKALEQQAHKMFTTGKANAHGWEQHVEKVGRQSQEREQHMTCLGWAGTFWPRAATVRCTGTSLSTQCTPLRRRFGFQGLTVVANTARRKTKSTLRVVRCCKGSAHSASEEEEKHSDANEVVGIRTPLAYVTLATAQVLAAVFVEDRSALAEVAYFVTTAVSAMVIGVGRAGLEHMAAVRVSKQQALAAPLAASAVLLVCYVMLKYSGIELLSVLEATCTFGGLICVFEFVRPLLYSAARASGAAQVAHAKVGGRRDVRAGDVLSATVAIGVTLLYVEHGARSFVWGNVMGAAIAARVVATVQLESFATAAMLLLGLLAYDVWWVFATPVMEAVATQLHTPARLVLPAVRDATHGSMLGLGDVCVPGLFVRVASALDATLARGARAPYGGAALGAYGVALLAAFVANELTETAQPALLYVSPALLLATLGAARARRQLSQVLAFRRADGDGDDDAQGDARRRQPPK